MRYLLAGTYGILMVALGYATGERAATDRLTSKINELTESCYRLKKNLDATQESFNKWTNPTNVIWTTNIAIIEPIHESK